MRGGSRGATAGGAANKLVGTSGALFANPTPRPTETARNETMIASLDAAEAGTLSGNKLLMARPPPKPAPVAAATPLATAEELANVDEVLAADAAALLAA